MCPGSRSPQRKAAACNSKTNDQKLMELGRNMCYDNARSSLIHSFWHLTSTMRDIFCIFFQFKLSALNALAHELDFLYGGTTRSSLSFKMMGLMPRSRQQKRGSAQVCAPLGHSLIHCCDRQQPFTPTTRCLESRQQLWRLLRCVRSLRVDYHAGRFGAPQAGGCKWQNILIDTLSSLCFVVVVCGACINCV